jgi:rubrerythrin
MANRIMNVEFNAFEIFEIAIKIERNAVKFYRRAAEVFDNPRIKKIFLELAEWEIKHVEVFETMKKQLSEQSSEMRTFKPENNLLIDAQSMAGLAVFGIRTDPTDELTGNESVVDVLNKAIEKEKDTIVYYTGLKAFIPVRQGRDKIDDIIREEMHHVHILGQSLQERQQFLDDQRL